KDDVVAVADDSDGVVAAEHGAGDVRLLAEGPLAVLEYGRAGLARGLDLGEDAIGVGGGAVIAHDDVGAVAGNRNRICAGAAEDHVVAAAGNRDLVVAADLRLVRGYDGDAKGLVVRQHAVGEERHSVVAEDGVTRAANS